MYGYICGTLIAKRAGNKIVIKLNSGIGYVVSVPGVVFNNNNLEDIISRDGIFLETKSSENSVNLYGFLSENDRLLFERVTSIQGVGSKVGLAIFDRYESDEFMALIAMKDIQSICMVSGIGKKGAENIIKALSKFVLSDPLKISDQIEVKIIRDKVVNALVAMGYDRSIVVKEISQEESNYLLKGDFNKVIKDMILKIS